MMTREEIIEAYEGAVFSSGLSAAAGNEEAAKDYELLKAGLDALRFPTREMVERMRGEWKNSYPLIECQVCGEIYSRCGGNEGKPFDFCPACGSPMTDEAVDILLKRWKEALKDG